MKVEISIDGLDGVVERLRKLPPEVVSKNGGIVLKALRKGANVIKKHARSNLERSVRNAGKTGVSYATGFTEKKIVLKRGRMRGNGERVIVTVRPDPHPNQNKYRKRNIQANDIAFIMEHGSSKQPAEPWMRPAFNAQREWAMETAKIDLLTQLDKVVAKLALQGK